ncbi:MAG: prepilin peptidase [Rhodospirillaceae bacterium]|nr:prepilin peptidase [Rhodospirillales bacterium]
MFDVVIIIAGLSGLVFVAALVDAAASDLRAFRIPNRDSLLIAVAFGLAVPAFGFGLEAAAWHVAAAAAAFTVGAVLFVLKVWGGGDAKLVAAVTLMTGFAGLPRFLLVMALAGGMLSLVLLLLRRLPANGSWGARVAASGHVPYGVAIAAGGMDWAVLSLLPRLAG